MRTRKHGVIALDWWWLEAGPVFWVGGRVKWKAWGTNRGWRV